MIKKILRYSLVQKLTGSELAFTGKKRLAPQVLVIQDLPKKFCLGYREIDIYCLF